MLLLQLLRFAVSTFISASLNTNRVVIPSNGSIVIASKVCFCQSVVIECLLFVFVGARIAGCCCGRLSAANIVEGLHHEQVIGGRQVEQLLALAIVALVLVLAVVVVVMVGSDLQGRQVVSVVSELHCCACLVLFTSQGSDQLDGAHTLG